MSSASTVLLAAACGAGPAPLQTADTAVEVDVHSAGGPAIASPTSLGPQPARATACSLPAAEARLALSIDGSEDGVFVTNMGGQTGELTIDPAGQSRARVDYGVMHFDAPVSLASTTLKAAFFEGPLGGILSVSPDARMVVSGGTGERLELRLVDSGELQWTTAPTKAVSCDALRSGAAPRPMPVRETGTRTVVMSGERSGVRASQKGPVVAYLRAVPATVLEERAGALRIRASTAMGDVVGWVDDSEWQKPQPSPPAPLHGIGTSSPTTSGPAPLPVHVRCALGSPVFVLRNGRTIRVGRIYQEGDTPLTDKTFDISGGLKTERTNTTDPRYVVPLGLLNVTEERQIILIGGDLVVDASSCK